MSGKLELLRKILSAQPTRRELLSQLIAEDTALRANILRAELPELALIKHRSTLPINQRLMDILNSENLALRWERGRGTTPFQPEVRHYDPVGGGQMLQVIRSVPNYLETTKGRVPISKMLQKNLRSARIRVAPLSALKKQKISASEVDPFIDISSGWYEPPNVDNPLFYYNEAEEILPGAGYGTPEWDAFVAAVEQEPSKFLIDSALRRYGNTSLAVPADSAFHRRAAILRAAGGPA